MFSQWWMLLLSFAIRGFPFRRHIRHFRHGLDRGHVLVLNRIDSVPQSNGRVERCTVCCRGPAPIFVDARQGRGVDELKRAIIRAGKKVNERRQRRGINPRPVRAAILGYPNVGKSALINRLVGRKKTKSENRPGVTRGFTWVRIDKQVQLLDSPGIIPAKQVEQCAAYHLAMCDDIGNAAYDTQGVAAALLERLFCLATPARFARLETLRDRWGVGLDDCDSGETYLSNLAERASQATCSARPQLFSRTFGAGS